MAEAKNNQTPDVSEQDKIRRGKLADLQAAGNDPFLMGYSVSAKQKTG